MRFNRSLGSAGQLVLFASALGFGLVTSFAAQASAQDHEHDHLHFSHPLVTESPSPDTKLRFDLAATQSNEPAGFRSSAVRIEGEYGFANSFSLALVVPFARITAPRDARASSLGSIELSAKAATFAFDEAGVLLGGGVTAGLPTGNDRKGIASGHIVEVAPFVDAALKKGNIETVAFLALSAPLNRKSADDDANSVTLDASALWRAIPAVELLAELSSSRRIGKSASPSSETFLAPGVKWHSEKHPALAIGASAIRGIGRASGTNALQLSAFYHF